MSRPQPKLEGNVLPEALRGKRLTGRQKLFLVGIIALMALLFPVYNLTTSAVLERSKMVSQLDALNQQLAVKQDRIQEVTRISDVVEQYGIITKNRGILSEDFQTIIDSADKVGIDVLYVTHKGVGETITVDSQAPGYTSFEEYRNAYRNFAEALLQTARFSSVNYPPLDYPPSANIIVTIQPKK